MESKTKFLGHAMHPILIVFPLGLLATSVIFDLIFLIWNVSGFGVVVYWLISAGIIGGLLAAPFGTIDWLAIPSGTRAKRIGAIHGLVNVGVLLIFFASWWMRNENAADPGMLAHALSLIGLGVALVGGWLGGELVERLGVSIDDGANLNAPNSLTGSDANAVNAETAHI